MTPRPTVWLTRDSFEGTLENHVDVWSECPTRSVHLGDERESLGVTWWDSNHEIDARVSRMPIAVARQFYRTIPETDRECVRVG